MNCATTTLTLTAHEQAFRHHRLVAGVGRLDIEDEVGARRLDAVVEVDGKAESDHGEAIRKGGP